MQKIANAGEILIEIERRGIERLAGEKASRRWVSAAARWAPRNALAIERCRFAALSPRPGAVDLTLSRLPMMIIRRLLKSWAIPPLS